MKVFCLSAGDHAVNYYRQTMFAHRLQEMGRQVIISNYLTPEVIHGSEIISLCGINPNSINTDLIAHFRSKGIKVIWDLDDSALRTEIGVHHPVDRRRLLWSITYQEFIKWMLQNIDGLFVTTKALQEYYRKHTPAPIFVVPNCLDEKVWSNIFKPVDFRWGDRPIIGWSGGSSHVLDLEMMVPAFTELGKKGYIIRCIGNYPESLAGSDFVECIEWSQELPMYYQSMALAAFDAAIAPIQNTVFNLHKSNIKLLEYSAYSGVPIIASDIGPYRNNPVPGVRLVKNETKHWVRGIGAAVEESRSKPRNYHIPEGYDLSTGVKVFESALKSVIG